MPEKTNETKVGFLDRIETARAKAYLVGAIIPRAISSSIAASRRNGETGIPAWNLGVREFAETATDELFIAISAFYRDLPDLEAVKASVAQCQGAAAELTGLGVAGAHTTPPRMQVLGLRRRRLGPIRFEHLEYESRPTLPESLLAAGHGRVEVAHARILRHAGEPRPWLVWVHGAEQGRLDDLFAFRARHLHEELGLNVVFPVLPQHGPRREHGRPYPGFDLLGNVATTIRAVSDVRSVIGWIGEQDPVSTAVIGMSLGGPVAALTAELDPAVDSVAVMVPMMDAAKTIAHHLHRTGGRGRTLAALLRSDAVHQVSSVVDPLVLEPHAPPDRRLVVAALNDRMTSIRAAQRLNVRWGGQVHWHAGGHIGHLMSNDVRLVVDQFLLGETVDPGPVPTEFDS